MQHDLLAPLSARGAEQLHRPVAGQTVCLIIGQFRPCAQMTKAVDPFDSFASINPQMPSLIALVRQVLRQPFANHTIRNAKIFRKLRWPIQHRQEARRTDDDGVWQSLMAYRT
jgi:hypothetical protein